MMKNKILSLFLAFSLSITAITHMPISEVHSETSDADKYPAGMYKAGVDIEPGVYRVVEDGNTPLFVISDDANQKETIQSSIFKNTACVKINDGQYLELRNAFLLKEDELKPLEIEGNTIQDGWYVVGLDIAAGEYKVTSTGDKDGLVVIYDELNPKDVYKSSLVESDAYIDVVDSQIIELKDLTITDDKLTDFENENNNDNDENSGDDEEEDYNGKLLDLLTEGGVSREDAIKKYCSNILNTMFYHEFGIVEYISETETFELTLTDSLYQQILSSYNLGKDSNPDTWSSMLTLFEMTSSTITTDMGDEYKFSVLDHDADQPLLIYSKGELIENNLESGNEFIH